MFVWNRYRNALHLMDFYVLVGNYRYLTYEVPGAGAPEPDPFFPEPEPERSPPQIHAAPHPWYKRFRGEIKRKIRREGLK